MMGTPARRARAIRLALGLCLVAGLLCAPLRPAGAAEDRDYTRVIGQPETLSYAASVANALSMSAHRKFPQIEQSSQIGAQRAFCTKLGDSPDVMFTPIPRGAPEGGVCPDGAPVVRLTFGRQVIALYTAPGAPALQLTREQLFRAFARELPRRDATSVSEDMFGPNPNKRWRDISPDLPDVPIRIMGPPQRSVFWLSFEDLLMEPTCMALPQVAELEKRDPPAVLRHCLARRSDGAITYADGAAYVASPRLLPRGTEVAINERRAMLMMPDAVAVAIDGVMPDDQALNHDLYPLARDIAAVAKVSRLGNIPNMRQFVVELTSKAAAGPNGYLTKTGLDPLPPDRLNESALKASTAGMGR